MHPALDISIFDPLNLQYGQSHSYSIDMDVKIHQSKRVTVLNKSMKMVGLLIVGTKRVVPVKRGLLL